MGYGQVDQTDREMMALALGQARASLDGGGVPVGAVLAAGGEVIAAGHSRASEAEFLAGAARDWDSGVAYNYAMITEGTLAGGIALMARIGPGGLEIGYWVHRAWTRRGLATAASAALVEAAFRLPGVDRVEIVHDELNVASAGIPRKLGFTEVARRPLDLPPPAGTGTGIVWRLVR